MCEAGSHCGVLTGLELTMWTRSELTKTHLPLLGLKACATIPVLNKTIIEKSQAISALRGSPQTQGQSASQWVSSQPGPQRETLYLKLQVKNNTESQDKATHEEHKGNVLRVKRKAKFIRDQSGNNAEQKLTSHTTPRAAVHLPGGPQDKPKASISLLFQGQGTVVVTLTRSMNHVILPDVIRSVTTSNYFEIIIPSHIQLYIHQRLVTDKSNPSINQLFLVKRYMENIII